MKLNELAESINKWAEGKGWNDRLATLSYHNGDAGAKQVLIDSIGSQVTNMHGELSEAWEEIRKGYRLDYIYHVGDKPEGFPIELADTIIRILHTCAFYGINIEAAIQLEMDYNHTREFRHGGKVA